MTTTYDYQQLNLKKQTKKNTKQTTRTGTELHKWRSYGGLSVGRRGGKWGGKGTGHKEQNW